MQDEGVELVGRNHHRLSGAYVLTTPPWEVVRRAQEKSLAYEAADRAGVDHPVTWKTSDAAALRRLPVRFPAIVKPSKSTALVQSMHRKALLANTPDELVGLYELALRYVPAAELLVQEFIPGGGENQYSFCGLVEDGRVLAAMTARRLRQYPIDFGMSSSLVEAVDVPELAKPAVRLLSELRLSGLVELEFKRHPDTGTFHLLDINARAWAWHSLCAACGLDFIDLQYRHALGEPVQPAVPRYSVRWRRVLTDIPAGVVSIRSRRISVRSYMRSLRGKTTYSVLDLRDLLPALVDLPVAVLRLRRRPSQPRQLRVQVAGAAREVPPSS
jgi:predicted ATP-grasp superfamily ATP-dependent carboligase